MIDKNIKAEYLDPVSWGRLGSVLNKWRKPKKKIVVYRSGEDLRAADSEGRTIDTAGIKGKGDNEVVHFLFQQDLSAEEVWIYEKDGLQSFYKQAQKMQTLDYTIEEYMGMLYDKRKEEAGIRKFVRNEKISGEKEFFGELAEVVKTLPEDCVMLWAVTQKDIYYFHVILDIEGGDLVRITTLDRYRRRMPGELWNHAYENEICEMIREEFQKQVVYRKVEWDEIN